MPTFNELTVVPPPPSYLDWNEDGVVVLPRFLPEDLMQAYESCWLANNFDNPGGWQDPCPYMRFKPLADMLSYGPLQDEMINLLGEPAGLHLCLTGWRSTTRNWHQDSYLNPPHVGDFYVAVWIALENIHPDSGPFQYIPGSHRWPQVTRETIAPHVNLNNPLWPTHSEAVLTPAFTAEIEKRGEPVVDYLPERGDVLLWHSRLVHRGSIPNDPNMERRAAIAHFSGIQHRSDMPPAIRHSGGYIFPIGVRTWR